METTDKPSLQDFHKQKMKIVPIQMQFENEANLKMIK